MVESTIDSTYVAVLILLDTRLQSLSLQAESTKLAVTTSSDNVVTTVGLFVLRRIVGIRQDVRHRTSALPTTKVWMGSAASAGPRASKMCLCGRDQKSRMCRQGPDVEEDCKEVTGSSMTFESVHPNLSNRIPADNLSLRATREESSTILTPGHACDSLLVTVESDNLVCSASRQVRTVRG